MNRWWPVLFFALFVIVSTGLAQDQDPLAKARQHREQGDFERAMEILHGLLEARGEDSAVLVEMARTSYAQADEILRSASPSLGQLALIDAIRWAERAGKASPADPVPHRLLGRAATRASDFDKAIAAYRHVVELEPADGESFYQLGFALSYRGHFREGIAAFSEAEKLLGPDARVYLNRGISHQTLLETEPAKADFLRAIDTEVQAQRLSTDPIKRSWTWLWRIHSEAKKWAAAEECFAALVTKYPKLTAPHWYLAHARMERQDHLGAATALDGLNRIAPTWAEAWRLKAVNFSRAERFLPAERAAWEFEKLEPGGDAARDLLLGLVRALNAKDLRPKAIALVMKVKEAFPDDPQVLAARGDLYFADGLMALAIADYRRTVELDRFGAEAQVKERKAVIALLRKGEAPEGGDALAAVEERGGSGGGIFDFERPQVFVRVNGRARGARDNKEFRVTRWGEPGAMANCSLTFVPTYDPAAATHLVFEVTGDAGKMMTVRAKDCYDEFGMAPVFVRLAHPEPIALSGERQTVRLALDEFVSVVDRRPIPMNRSRLRMLVFEIGLPLTPEDDLAREIRIDNVRFEGDGEQSEVDLIEDFNNDPEESIFLSDGVAAAFARTISRPGDIAGFRPDPNTFVTPAIMGEDYEPATVHHGQGSYRLTLPGAGAASAVLSFNPDRSFDFADALVFWARGTTGGEKVRVTIRDALDDDLDNAAPARAPRLLAGSTLIEGHFVLSKDWRKFRIPRSAFPDIHFDALAEIRFHVGTNEGNEPGARIYLDSIRWE